MTCRHFLDVWNAIGEVAGRMVEINEGAGSFDYVLAADSESVDVRIASYFMGDDESYYIDIPWRWVELHVRGENWERLYEAQLAKEEEAKAAELAALRKAREAEREQKDKADWERLRAKFGSSTEEWTDDQVY